MKELIEMGRSLKDMGFLELLAILAGLYVVLPRIYYFVEVMQISFGVVQKDLLRRYYNYNTESYAVITGGTAHIGKELAMRLGKIGFSIVLIGKNKDKLEDTKKRILAQSRVRVKIILADLASNKPEIYSQHIYPELKDLDIAIFVNNCYDCARGYFKDIPLERLHKQLMTNSLHYLYMLHFLANKMQEREGMKRSAIINI